MAERAGVDAKVLRAILMDDPTAMPDDVALAWRFTRATLDHDPAAGHQRNPGAARRTATHRDCAGIAAGSSA